MIEEDVKKLQPESDWSRITGRGDGMQGVQGGSQEITKRFYHSARTYEYERKPFDTKTE